MVNSPGDPQQDDPAFREWDPFADPADIEPTKAKPQLKAEELPGRFAAKAKDNQWDPFADPTVDEEEAEEAARVEEAKEQAEREAFGREVELEVEIMARARAEAWEEGAVRGAALQVQLPGARKPSEKADMFFGDALCKAVAALEACFKQESNAVMVVHQFLEARFHPIATLVQGLMHQFYPPSAAEHFQCFCDICMAPDGLRDTIGKCFQEDAASPASQLPALLAHACALLREALRAARRMVEALATPDQAFRQEFFRHLWTLCKAQECNPLEYLLPDVAAEEALDIVVSPAGSTEFLFPLRVHQDLMVGQLRELLVVRLQQPRDARLVTEVNGAAQAMHLHELLRSYSPHVLVEGMGEIRDDDAASWRIRKPMFKITTESGTRLLAELRARYQEPDFYREYHELRRAVKPGGEALHIQKALSVQSVILPKYGFDGTLRGVMDMRTQVSFLAEFDPPLFKALKDIHKMLDAHQDLPKMPVVRPIEAPRYAPEDSKGWIAHLVDEGFAVIGGVLEEEQVKEAYGLLWDFLEEADQSSVVQRHDVETWFGPGHNGTGWAGAADDGIIAGRGIGQSEVLWFLRGLPAVQKVYADLWGTDRLVASFDGAGVFRPYGVHREWKISKKNWYHLDQAHYKRGLHCVQGLINLKDASEETGGLVVVPRSHRFHNDICSKYKEGDSDFLPINVNDRVLTEGNMGPRMVVAKAGDMVLWDSRTVHCNTAPLKENRELLGGNDLVRAVCYVCMTPAAWCTEETLRRRQQGVRDGVTTAHWPHEYHPKNTPKVARPPIRLSREQMRLVCPSDEHPSTNAPQGVKPGSISFLPARQLSVAHESVSLRRSPTTEWDAGIGSSLRRGEPVAGYILGEWVRLISWPHEAGRPHPLRHLDEEIWAYMGPAGSANCAFTGRDRDS